MKLYIYGKPENISVSLIRESLVFYGRRLMSYQLCANLKIKVFFTKDLFKNDNLEAVCCWDDDNNKPREFILKLDADLTKRNMLLACAHEMVHIKQWATRQMVIRSGEKYYKWNGKLINDDKVSYKDLPWEIEAWEKEHILYREFLTYLCKKTVDSKMRS